MTTLALKISISFICLVFVFSTVEGSAWVEKLELKGPYIGEYCNAYVSCYVYSSEVYLTIFWKLRGGPYGATNIRKFPGISFGEIENNGYNKYMQTISITKCYNKLEFICKVDISVRNLTLATGSSWVENLEVAGPYSENHCNAKVSCYVYSSSLFPHINWSCTGCTGAEYLNHVPGLTIEQAQENGFNKYKQTISVAKCYKKLEFSCSVGSSKKTVTLSSERHRPSDKGNNLIPAPGQVSIGSESGISGEAIIGISVGAMLLAIILIIILKKMKRGRVIGRGFDNAATNINPPPGTYPTQPQAMVYPGTNECTSQQPPPPTYTEATYKY